MRVGLAELDGVEKIQTHRHLGQDLQRGELP